MGNCVWAPCLLVYTLHRVSGIFLGVPLPWSTSGAGAVVVLQQLYGMTQLRCAWPLSYISLNAKAPPPRLGDLQAIYRCSCWQMAQAQLKMRAWSSWAWSGTKDCQWEDQELLHLPLPSLAPAATHSHYHGLVIPLATSGTVIPGNSSRLSKMDFWKKSPLVCVISMNNISYYQLYYLNSTIWTH